MNPANRTLLSLIFFLLTTTSTLATSQQSTITMTLPDSVIKEAIPKVLPLYSKVDSQTLLGSVSIDKVENLQLQKNKISSRITISGHDLNLVTNIVGHDIRMKIGSLTLSFQCDATIRYDSNTQTLYLRPVVTEIQKGNNDKADITSALILLFNNQEFPLQLEKLQPIMADTGNKTLNISMHIADIKIHPGKIQLEITPTIGVNKKKIKK